MNEKINSCDHCSLSAGACRLRPREIDACHAEQNKAAELEAELRALWTAQGVPVERQDAILAEVEAKAQPGAMVGPFRIGGNNA